MVEKYEDGRTSMNTLNTFLSRLFSSQDIAGSTAGQPYSITIKVEPEKAREKFRKTELFEADEFEGLELVDKVQENEEKSLIVLYMTHSDEW